jgi:type IV secretory pathway TrbL component
MPPSSPVRRSNNFNNQSICTGCSNACNATCSDRNILNEHLISELKSMKKYENNISVNLSVLIWTIVILILILLTYVLFSLKTH